MTNGGARIITFNVEVTAEQMDITLLTIYDKNEMESVSDCYIHSLLAELRGKA